MLDLLHACTLIIGKIADHLLAIGKTPKLASAWTALLKCEEELRRLKEMDD